MLGLLVAAASLAGCYAMRPSAGGGQTRPATSRAAVPADVAIPDGYRIEAVATGLTFPVGVTFDARGRPHVVESGYAYGEVWLTPRLLRIEETGPPTVIATGGDNGPWNGLAFHDGVFLVAEGGAREGGRILRIEADGRARALVDGLPSLGDHHTNGPAIGPDGWLYFGQGTATNAAVVGTDNATFGWLARHPDFHDIPCRDVTLAGENYESDNPVTREAGDRATTGAYLPFGTPSTAGQVIRGSVPCSGAVLRVPVQGGAPELVAWGFRNPFGLAFAPDGRLLVSDNGYDERGSRPAWGTPDVLWSVTPGSWYGWPDFSAGQPLSEDTFTPPGEPRVRLVLASPPGTPPKPVASFGVHSSSNGLDVSRSPAFGHVGQAFVAQFGDMAPGVGKVLRPVGFRVVRVDLESGTVEEFAANRSRDKGPASKVGGGGLERPVAVRFDPSGASLYVVDFGVMTVGEHGPRPEPGTGVLWRISRQGATP